VPLEVLDGDIDVLLVTCTFQEIKSFTGLATPLSLLNAVDDTKLLMLLSAVASSSLLRKMRRPDKWLFGKLVGLWA
jgi:hypothetical protein